MMKHLQDNNETYITHFFFAAKVGFTLILRGVIFLGHALLPFGNVPPKWNLEATALQLCKWDEYTRQRMQK